MKNTPYYFIICNHTREKTVFIKISKNRYDFYRYNKSLSLNLIKICFDCYNPIT